MLSPASHQVLLHRHSGQRYIPVGVSAANRNRLEPPGPLCSFIHTKVLRAQIDPPQRLSHPLQVRPLR